MLNCWPDHIFPSLHSIWAESKKLFTDKSKLRHGALQLRVTQAFKVKLFP